MLSNEAMAIVVADLGGQILSLASRRTGREWLWTNSRLPARTPVIDPTSFGPYDTGGWDEIFPTVAPCTVVGTPWDASAIADHGVLWSRVWTRIAPALNSSWDDSLTQVVEGEGLPFRFCRRLTLQPGDGPLLCEYELTNVGDQPLPWMWAAHPLVAVAPGMRLGLPAGTRCRIGFVTGLDLPPGGDEFEWPIVPLADGATIDLSEAPEPRRLFAIKLFTERLREGSASVTTAGGDESLELRFDLRDVPYVGLWLNYGAWSGNDAPPYYNCGVEPTTSPHERLNDALRADEASWILPGASVLWRLDVRLTNRAAGERF